MPDNSKEETKTKMCVKSKKWKNSTLLNLVKFFFMLFLFKTGGFFFLIIVSID